MALNHRTRAPRSNDSTRRFSSIEPTRVPRSAFDNSYNHSTTLFCGYLVPMYREELLPGDTISVRPTFFARALSTFQKVPLTGFWLDYQFFVAPTRILWENWVRMHGERPDPADHNDYTVPIMTSPASTGYGPEDLSVYLGVPLGVPDLDHISLYHRMYALCFQEWYRDENLTDQVVVDLDDGPDDPADYPLFKRGKRKDYFTSALPFAQKGDPVSLPLGTTAPVVTNEQQIEFKGPTQASAPFRIQSGALYIQRDGGTWGATEAAYFGDETGLEVDLASATAATINSIRQAVAVQHLLERDARGGTRYREMVLSHFGVQTDDIRLLRPQLLATGSIRVGTTEIAQTSSNVVLSPLGIQSSYATAAHVGRSFVYSATEHSLVLGIVSIRAELAYQQGLDRAMTRQTRYDYYYPDLANLGEQAILSREIFADGTGDPDLGTGDYEVWGYTPRYEEYRHRQNVISGQLKSDYSLSLDIWHSALDFATRPSLNNAFIEENPPFDRLLALPDLPHFIVDGYFKVRHVRPMPRFARPGLLRF